MSRPHEGHNPLEERRLLERLAGALPRDFVELDVFLSISRVRITRATETAAVTRGDTVELWVNPDFVERHALNDQELATLLLHEIHHVLLGHARMGKSSDLITNIAMDAVINAMICRRKPYPEVMSLFQRLYRTDRLPEALLRPPEHWPGVKLSYSDPDVLKWIPPPCSPDSSDLRPKTRWQRTNARRAAVDLVNRLYPEDCCASLNGMPTVTEIVEFLRSLERDGFIDTKKWQDVVLLGDHGEGGQQEGNRAETIGEDLAEDLRERVREAAGGLGVGTGSALGTVTWNERRFRREFRRAVRSALERAATGQSARGLKVRRLVERIEPSALQTPLPHPRDRTQHVKRVLTGRPPMLYTAPGTIHTRAESTAKPVLVYVDVSGSMGRHAEDLAEALRPYGLRRQAEIFAFSDGVQPMSLEDLRQRRYGSSGGTSIESVLDHLAKRGKERKALIITDGIVGPEPAQAVRRIRRRGTEIHLAVTEHGRRMAPWLANRARSVTTLPNPEGDVQYMPDFGGALPPIDPSASPFSF